MRTFVRFLLTAGIQALIACALLEVIGRVLDPLGISYYPETARFYDDLVMEEPIGYRLPENMRARYWGTAVDTNSLGMRDREVGPKAPEEFRVMLLGDSVIFSLGVEYADSIPWQLEQMLNAGTAPGRRYRVLNMGVPSYNTEQELIQLESLGLGLQPDAVLLMFVPNDLEKKKWVYEKRSSPLADLAQRSYAASLLFVAARQVGRLLGSSRGASDAPSAAPARNPRWQAIDTALTGITTTLRERGIPFMVVSRGADDDPHLAVLRELAVSRDFRFDVLDAQADPNRTPEDPASLIISATNSHCNPHGCAAIARSLGRLLEAGGLLQGAPGAPAQPGD